MHSNYNVYMATEKTVTLYVISSEEGSAPTALETPWSVEDIVCSPRFDVFSPDKSVYEWVYAVIDDDLSNTAGFVSPNFTGWSAYELDNFEYNPDDENMFSESYVSYSESTCGCDWKLILDQDNTDLGVSIEVESSVTIVAPDGNRETISEADKTEQREKIAITLTNMLENYQYHSGCFYANGHLSWNAEENINSVVSPYENIAHHIKLLEISDVPSYDRCFPVVETDKPDEILWASIEVVSVSKSGDIDGGKYKMLNVTPKQKTW